MPTSRPRSRPTFPAVPVPSFAERRWSWRHLVAIWRLCWVVLIAAICGLQTEAATSADRTTLLIPVTGPAAGKLPQNSVFADEAFGALEVPGWNAYIRLWKAHHSDPANPTVRRYLGLPLQGKPAVKQRRGRSAPRWLAWRSGTYHQAESAHFVIYSRADKNFSEQVALDCERCYWAWTQMFFPLWESRRQVAATFKDLAADQSVVDSLRNQSSRLSVPRKLRIVLFRDATEYQQTIDVPGIERSTGFYSDERKTTFLYADDVDDAATRRHELVHQLFRESTNSQLRRSMPGERSDFWLVEGIAGYFESLHIDRDSATVGGWDSPRLQFARHRFFIGGDRMPMSQLRQDGRLAAQERSDIARWYAHAIAQTHRLIDGGNHRQRQWVYGRLAELYKVDTDTLYEGAEPGEADEVLKFLSIDDAHILQNPILRQLSHLCLAGCRVTEAGLRVIKPAPALRQLTLVGQPIGTESVKRLIVNPDSIRQLSLERTKIDPSIADLLARANNLRELDLSGTSVGDTVIDAIGNAKPLTTLWMTGTEITDQSIAAIAKLPVLQNVDLQQTKVTPAGIRNLEASNPDLNVNPLEIQSAQ